MSLKISKNPELLLKTLKTVSEILNKNNIIHFVFFGTLLGLIRDKNIIQNDDDIDFYVDILERQKLINLLKKNFKLDLNIWPNNTNFFLQAQFLINDNKIPVDFYLYENNSNQDFIIDRWNFIGIPENEHNHLKIPKKLIFQIQKKKIKFEEYSFPSNPEKICEFLYDKSWKNKVIKDREYKKIVIDGRPFTINYKHPLFKVLTEQHNLSEEVTNLKEEVNKLENQILQIKNSNSWKITKPLRHFKNLLTKK